MQFLITYPLTGLLSGTDLLASNSPFQGWICHLGSVLRWLLFTAFCTHPPGTEYREFGVIVFSFHQVAQGFLFFFFLLLLLFGFPKESKLLTSHVAHRN